MKKYTVLLPLCLCLAGLMTATAYAQELAVGGQAVGIQAELDGLMVAGLASVQTAEGEKRPAEEAGLLEGDFITDINGRRINSTADFAGALSAADGGILNMTVSRSGETKLFKVNPVRGADGQWAVGVWLRDGISGIGTLTFYDPESGIYGALGHCISVSENGAAEIERGSITDAEILSVTRGHDGDAGALNGCADVQRVLGSVDRNSRFGIYGKANMPLGGAVFETGPISAGRAQILATVAGHNAKAYDVEINRVYNESDGCHVMLTVIDNELCGITGGIVQGMSGSPIIQNGRLVGAVTHVFLSDSRKGYGISIDDMLAAAGICSDSAA